MPKLCNKVFGRGTNVRKKDQKGICLINISMCLFNTMAKRRSKTNKINIIDVDVNANV